MKPIPSSTLRPKCLWGSPRKRSGFTLQRGLISISLLLPLLSAKGQDALFNALSLQQAIAAQSNPALSQPNQPHLGPVLLALGAHANFNFNDNINGSQNNPESDVISEAGATLGFDWPATERSDLRLGTGVGYIHYFRYTANNGLEVTPNSALTYSLSWKDLVLTLYDQLSYTRQVTTEAALANVATLPQFDNTVGARAEWDPGHWAFQASYGHDIYLSDTAHNYLNRASEDLYGQAGWRFALNTQAGFEASASLAAYQLASQGNVDSYSIGPYVQWQILQSLNLTLRGGPTIYQFQMPSQGGGNSSLNSYYASLIVSQQLTDYLSQSLSVNQSVQLGANQGASYVKQLSVGYSISWALTQRISLGASVTYDNGQQPFTQAFFLGIFPINTTENFEAYGGGLQASWRFTDHLTASLGYNHTLRDSNLAGRNFSDNSVFLGMSYTF